MGITLPVPLAPFQQLDVQGESITIDVNAKQIVIPTDNQYLLPSFNQWTLNPSRCNLEETPCGGLKNSIVQDTFPGSLTIEGDGCYLKNVAGTYTGKSIGAGKLSETSSIVDSESTGIALATADGIEVQTIDGNLILFSLPYAIVEQFKVINISTDTVAYTITLKCPDSISSIELQNLTTGFSENLEFNKISENEYTFSKSINQNYSESFQLTIQYDSLDSSQTFSNDANMGIGIENMSESWIAWLPSSGPDIDFIHFSERPQQLSCKQNPDGTISQITLFPGNGNIYHGRITHSDHSRVSDSGYVPDCLNKNMPGSITKFLQAHGMKTDFPSNAEITTWVVPAITDSKILPFSPISDDLLSDAISMRMCPGEYGCASFVIDSDKDLNLDISASDLENGEYTIPKENIDIRIVKRWYQDGDAVDALIHGRVFTPELLLHDDSLIQVEGDSWSAEHVINPNGKNYLKVNDSYIDISQDNPKYSNSLIIPIEERPIKDADILQPVKVSPLYNNQFWITIHIPQDAVTGNYSAAINLSSENHVINSISLNIQVLPITLSQPNIEYSMYSSSRIYGSGSISGRDKTVEQYTAEMQNMINHGIINPVVYNVDSDSTLIQELSIRQAVGMDNSILYYWTPSYGNGMITVNNLSNYFTLLAPYGVKSIYLYGKDEQTMNDTDKTTLSAIHNAGGKMFVAQNYTQADGVADILDLAVVSYEPSITLAAKYHDPTGKYDSVGHKVFSYYNPQSTPEYPLTFRRNYGLVLWIANYDGAMDAFYLYGFGDSWNDFDSVLYRDHCFVYPTANGVIDTVQWEGFREAVNDMRYLASLQAAMTEANSRGVATIDIESWLLTLKNTNLINVNLDDTRSQMIDFILQLQSSENYSAVLMADDNPIIFSDGSQLFLEV